MRSHFLMVILVLVASRPAFAADSAEQWTRDNFANDSRSLEESKIKAFVDGLLPEESKVPGKAQDSAGSHKDAKPHALQADG